MAIIKNTPGVSVTVDVDNIALREWQDASEAPAANTSLCYVEAASNRLFTVTVRVSAEARFEKTAMVFCLYADGKYVTSQKVFPGTFQARTHIVFRSLRDGEEIRKFRFSALDIVPESDEDEDDDDDDHYMINECDLLSLGELSVKMYHAEKKERKPDSARVLQSRLLSSAMTSARISQANELVRISEKAIKGRSVSHSVRFDGTTRGNVERHRFPPRTRCDILTVNTRELRRRKLSRYKYTNGPLVSTFTFRYRSAKALQSLLVMPRSPSPPRPPPPLVQRPSLFHPARVEPARPHTGVQNGKTEENLPVQTKREDNEDSPRPRKVARPNVNKIRYELDESSNVHEVSGWCGHNEEVVLLLS